MEIIKIDIDDKRTYNVFENLEEKVWVIRFFQLKVTETRVFTTNHGFHIYVFVNNKLSNEDIVFLQLVLGSDYMRESYYWKRIKGKSILKKKGWNILFNEKFYDSFDLSKKSVEKYSKHLSKRLFKLWEVVI